MDTFDKGKLTRCNLIFVKHQFGKKPKDYSHENKSEAEQERHQKYGVKARLLNAYLMAREVIVSDPLDNISTVERVLGGLSVADLDELQVLCPDLQYRRLLFLCVEHKKENIARSLIMNGADMDITEQVSIAFFHEESSINLIKLNHSVLIPLQVVPRKHPSFELSTVIEIFGFDNFHSFRNACILGPEVNIHCASLQSRYFDSCMWLGSKRLTTTGVKQI